jgi:hypothetical protein
MRNIFGHKDALSNSSTKGTKRPITVLMACPTFGLEPNPGKWHTTFICALNEFSLRGWKVMTWCPYRRPVVDADNEITSMAITQGYDYIFRMDDDISGFQDGFVNKLIDADKDIISGAMYTAGFPYSRCAFKKKDKSKTLIEIYEKKLMELEEVEGSGIQPCDMTATPFTLIKTSIFEKIYAPYYGSTQSSEITRRKLTTILDLVEGGELSKEKAVNDILEETRDRKAAPDSCFFQKLLDAEIQPYVHMGVQVNHRHVTPWNRHYLYNAEARAMMQNGLIKDKESAIYKTLAEQFGEDGKKDLLMLKGVHLTEEGKR